MHLRWLSPCYAITGLARMMWRSITIDYAEPALWVAVVVGCVFGLLLGGAFGVQIARVDSGWRAGIAMLAAGVVSAILAFLVTLSVLSVTVGAIAEGASACTDFVRPALYAPAVLGVATQALMWLRERRTLAGARSRRTRA